MTRPTCFIRDDLTVLLVEGDRSVEFRLDPYMALAMARDLLAVALAQCDREAEQRIARAAGEQRSSACN